MPLLVVSAALAVCPSNVAGLLAEIGAAEAAYAAMDLPAFAAASTRANADLGCVIEVLAPADAAAWHRMVALDAHTTGDKGRAIAAFRAALAIQPAYVLPSTLAPPGNPLHVLYEAARALGPGKEVPFAATDTVQVDGRRAATRPTERPALVQVIAADGAVTSTAWYAAGSFLPEPEPLATSTLPPTPKPKPGPGVPLLVAGGASALVAGGLYAAALAMRSDYDANLDTRSPSESEQLRSTTNATVYTSAGVGVVAVGLLTVGLITVKW